MTKAKTNIIRQLVAEDQRTNHTADLFGAYFPLRLEPFVYTMSSRLSDDYSGGYWHFYTLSNGGFYMALKATANSRSSARTAMNVSCRRTPWGSRPVCMPTAICRSVKTSLPTRVRSCTTCYGTICSSILRREEFLGPSTDIWGWVGRRKSENLKIRGVDGVPVAHVSVSQVLWISPDPLDASTPRATQRNPCNSWMATGASGVWQY